MGRRSQRRILNPARTAAAMLWVMLLIAGACSGDRTLDGSQLENELLEQLLPSYPGAIRSISCPDTSDPVPGQELLCVATMNDQVLDVQVELGGTPEELTSTASIDARFVAVNEISALLAATFGDEIGLVTSVDCGQPVMVLAATDTVACNATDPSGITRIFDVSISNAGVLELSLR